MNRTLVRTLVLGAALIAASGASAQDALILTGVIDGPLTGGTPKAIELYVAEDVADLSVYAVGSANNGGGTDGPEFTLSGAATAGDFLYVSNELPNFTAFFGFAPDYTSSAANVNGDDAIELFYDATGAFTGAETVVDVFGDINTIGTGQPWEYLDGWAYRVDFTGPDGSTFVLGNWTFSGPNALDGETTNGTAATPFPSRSYSPGTTVAQAVYDGPGWRLLSAPVSGLTVDDLAEINLVQGIDAGAANEAQYASAGANLFTAYTGNGTTAAYDAPADTDEIIAPGRGFWWYWYDQDAGPFTGGTSQGYELSSFVLTATGSAETTDVTEAFTNNAGDFYMIGNPFADDFTLSGASSDVGTLSTSFFAYDPSAVSGAGAYVTLSDTDDLAPWQGAFGQVTGEGTSDPTITYAVASAGGSGATFYGRVANQQIDLRLDGVLASGSAVGDRTARVRFLEDAEIGWDRHDLSELAPPNAEAAVLALVGERDGEAERQGVLSLPTSLTGEQTVPVAFRTTGDGTFAVSWDAAVLPSGWTAVLRDRVTVQEADLAADGEISFDAPATDWTDRFEIVLTAASVSTEAGAALDLVGDLFPNPAAGPVRLGVSLGAAQHVTATVFDAIGRKVAVAFTGGLGAGTQAIDFDAAVLAPGVYVVRVAGESFTEARRLVVTRRPPR